MDSKQSQADHLCVLVHGLWGNPVHLKYLEDTLKEAHEGEGLHILIPKSNSNNWTYDGIEVGGERITNEIEQTIKELEHGGAKVRKISVVGYSLGGLVARYAIGLLYKAGTFENIEPVNFTTFATPHLGVRAPKRGFGTSIWNKLGGRTLSTSGQQMFLIDEFRKSGRPLLSILADENSIFMKGLALFKNKSLYANIINDRSVPYYTAGISRTDPFVDLEQVQVHYAEGQKDDPVILSPEHPVSKRKPRRKSELMKMSFYQRYAVSEETRKSLPFYALFFALMPIAFPTFLINSAIQTYRSAQRVKLHEAGQAGISLGRYRIPLLEEAQHAQERAFERVATNQSAEYLPTPPPERSDDLPSKRPALQRSQTNRDPLGFPILALTDDQFRMIENLDGVGFEKFPVYIQKHRHTHAAIVVRTEKAGFEEGKAVVRHWAGRFEV